MFRTKLAFAVLAIAASIGAQAAVAQATSHGSEASPSFVTDTLAPGGGTSAPVQGYRIITDTLAPGGDVNVQRKWFVLEHASPAAEPQSYRFITDTLAPGGGSSEVVSTPSSSGFDWADAGIGAGATAVLMLGLLGSARLLAGRRRPVAA
jgi:hypothetical protein